MQTTKTNSGRWLSKALVGASCFCLMTGLASLARAATINVPGDHATIQAAIDAASPGDTVLVAAGTYEEDGQIVIDKNLTIIGAGRHSTIIKPAQNTGTSGDAQGWFLVQAGKIFNLSKVTLDGAGKNMTQAIRSHGTGVIKDNIIKNITGGSAAMSAVVMFNNMTIANNTIENIGRVGIWAFGGAADDVHITGNTYTGKGEGAHIDYGIEISGGAKATIKNNTITGCLGTVGIWTSAGIAVTDHWGSGSEAVITGNILNNNRYAIYAGYGEADESVVVADNNNISGNVVNGIRNLTVIDLDARFNWWGHTSGPYHEVKNPQGQGDAVSDRVLIDPWHTGFPDFEVVSIEFEPSQLTPGSTFDAIVTVTNSGSKKGDAGTLTVWVDRYAWATDSNGDAGKSVDMLEAGEGKAISFPGLTAPSNPDGMFHFRAFVDSENITAELDEDNNQLRKAYIFHYTNFKAKPDFKITCISGEIVPHVPGGTIVGTLTVANTGSKAGDAGWLTAWVDFDGDYEGLTKNPFGDGSEHIGMMEPGETQEWEFELQAATTYGTHTFLVIIDSQRATAEYSEWNNVKRCSYHFRRTLPDFRIFDISGDIDPWEPGGAIVGHVGIENSGSAVGPEVKLAAWVS